MKVAATTRHTGISVSLLSNSMGVTEPLLENSNICFVGDGFEPTPVQQGVGLFDQGSGDEDTDIDPTLEEGAEGGEEGGEAGDAPEGVDGASEGGEGDGEGDGEGGEDSDETDLPPHIEVDGQEVALQYSDEVKEKFKEAGLDLGQSTTELYSEKGLSDETRGKLNEAFGKAVVDLYEESALAKLDAQKAIASTEYQKNFNNVNTMAGGNAKELFSWADKNLTKADFTEIADALNSGNSKMQQYAIKELQEKSGIGATPEDGKGKGSDLIRGNKGVEDSHGGISAKEYSDAMSSGEYWKNPHQWDERRRAGQEAGI